jgi:hypothetical protein
LYCFESFKSFNADSALTLENIAFKESGEGGERWKEEFWVLSELVEQMEDLRIHWRDSGCFVHSCLFYYKKYILRRRGEIYQ